MVDYWAGMMAGMLLVFAISDIKNARAWSAIINLTVFVWLTVLAFV